MYKGVQIVQWTKEYEDDFVRLNKEWIEQYFQLEECDLKVLNDPEKQIIQQGGDIFFAIADGKVVGCCALIFHPEKEKYELGKMAVSPEAQGQGIGYQLGSALLQYAQTYDIKHLYLEANTKLEASIKLYYKLGFQVGDAKHSAYGRCNLYMERTM